MEVSLVDRVSWYWRYLALGSRMAVPVEDERYGLQPDQLPSGVATLPFRTESRMAVLAGVVAFQDRFVAALRQWSRADLTRAILALADCDVAVRTTGEDPVDVRIISATHQNLKDLVAVFLNHRREVVTRRTLYALGTIGIDPQTGAVRIARYVVAQDVGFAINPTYIEGQIEGGIAQGLGRLRDLLVRPLARRAGSIIDHWQ